jgi:hypothetical protein
MGAVDHGKMMPEGLKSVHGWRGVVGPANTLPPLPTLLLPRPITILLVPYVPHIPSSLVVFCRPYIE